jgi:hypothetical protein
LYEQLQHDNPYDNNDDSDNTDKSSTCLQKTLSLYPYLLVGGFPVSVVLSLCGMYIAYCVRKEIPVLGFAAAMAGIGLGLGLFTVILSLCCAHCKHKEEQKREAQTMERVTDIEMRIADVYVNE